MREVIYICCKLNYKPYSIYSFINSHKINLKIYFVCTKCHFFFADQVTKINRYYYSNMFFFRRFLPSSKNKIEENQISKKKNKNASCIHVYIYIKSIFRRKANFIHHFTVVCFSSPETSPKWKRFQLATRPIDSASGRG